MSPIAEAIALAAPRFSGQLLLPTDPAYDLRRRVHNGLIDKHPAAIASCRGVADIVDAVRLARTLGLEVSVRGGGHNVAGRATIDGGLMIDLSPMKRAPPRRPGPARANTGRARRPPRRPGSVGAACDRAARPSAGRWHRRSPRGGSAGRVGAPVRSSCQKSGSSSAGSTGSPAPPGITPWNERRRSGHGPRRASASRCAAVAYPLCCRKPYAG